MRDRHDPWKWPFSIGFTLVVFLGSVLLLPQPWIEAFFSPLSLSARDQGLPASRWLILSPPPAVETVPDQRPEPSAAGREPDLAALHQDPDWWNRGWAVMAEPVPRTAMPVAAGDSVAVLLAALGVERDFISRARPDSVLASRLFMLRLEESFDLEALKPYLSAMARSRDYADIYARMADMYDNFLQTEIMTPD